MVIFPTIEVQGDENTAVETRKTWFGNQMDKVLIDINNERIDNDKTRVEIGAELKKAILTSKSSKAF